MKYKYQKGISLIGVLVVVVFSTAALSVLYAYYKESVYKRDALLIQNSIIRLRDNIKSAMLHEDNCIKLNNRFIIDNGLLPKGFVARGLDPSGNDIIDFKYGRVDVGIVTLGGLPVSITNTDTFNITLSNYDFHKVPLMIEPLINKFDRVRWFADSIVATQGEQEGNWNFFLNYWGNFFDGQTGAEGDSVKSKIGFEMWDC